MKRFAALVCLLLALWPQIAPAVVIVIDDGHPIILPPRPPYPPHPPIPPWSRPQPHVFAPLEVSFLKVDTRIKDQVALTKVDQEFFNPNSRPMEGTFFFPAPKGAAISKFTVEIGGKPVEAELLPADKARGIYEDIVRRMKDPALLEFAGQDLFKLRIFPIEAHSRKRIALSYTQVLKGDNGLVGYHYPLGTGKYSAKPIPSVSVRVEIESKAPLKAVYSPSHTVEVKREGANRAVVGFEASNVLPEANFQLYHTADKSAVGANLLTHRTAAGEGFFLLLAAPGVEAKERAFVQKDLVFVLDTSGSMAGAKLEQAKKALSFCVENLNESDRFDILRFATDVEPLFGSFKEAAKANRERAQGFIKETKPIGGTAIDDALRKALDLLNRREEGKARPGVIVFLTDGRPTVGETSEEIIHANVKKSAGPVRLFCFGIGHDVNTHLLDKIAETARAFSQYVLPEEDIEVKVSNFYTKIKEPVLANPRLKFPEAAQASKFYPDPLPDLYKGEELVLVGRYAGTSTGHLLLEGSVNGKPQQHEYAANFPARENDHDFIPRLWATRRVGYLLDEIRLRGESKELKDEIAELARQYGIVTPYTAFLIIEDEQRRNVPSTRQTLSHLQRDREQLARAESEYRAFKGDKGGEKGVASARAGMALRDARNAADGIYLGQAEATGAPALAAPGGKLIFSPEAPRATLAYAQAARFAGGKNFFQNGAQWIDGDVQKQRDDAKKVRLQFASKEYFDLAAKDARVRPWLALGSNLQFVLDNITHEIYE
jgi:Ca-activated chloride channel family protein